MELTSFIYDFNLSTTGTVEDIYDKCLIINDGSSKNIDYNGCINLYQLVEKFNTSYLKYLKDKSELENILKKLGKDVFYGFDSISDDFSLVCFEVIEPFRNIFNGKRCLVNFVNNKETYYGSANNGKRRSNPNYERKKICLDDKLISSCLKIVKNHHSFLDSFNNLRINQIFGNGTTTVFTEIEGNIFDELTTFTLSFGNDYLNSNDFIKVVFLLGSKLDILYDQSDIVINDIKVTDTNDKREIIKFLLEKIFINSDKLPTLYREENNKQYVKKK